MPKAQILLVLGLSLMGIWGCAPPPSASSKPSMSGQTPAPPEDLTDIKLLRALSNAGVAPASPPKTSADKALVELGRDLFSDTLLSGNRDIACVTCHRLDKATSDGLSLSVGTKAVIAGGRRTPGAGRFYVSRNTPPLFNPSHRQSLFWDGRLEAKGQDAASLLAAQAAVPLTCAEEMLGHEGDMTAGGEANELAAKGLTTEERLMLLTQRVVTDGRYGPLLRAAYPRLQGEQLAFTHLADAIAAFEAAAFGSFDSAFDRYLEGDDGALSAGQKRGALLFYGRAKCSGCHRGILLTDQRFHNVGVPQVGPGRDGSRPLDLGRAEFTGKAEDRFRFRTPSLRNVALTGPWMHDGAYTSLVEVVEHYKDPVAALKGYSGDGLEPELRRLVHTREQLDSGALDNLDVIVGQGLELDPQEVEDLVSFLHALTGKALLTTKRPAPR